MHRHRLDGRPARPHEVLVRRVLHEVRRGDGRGAGATYPEALANTLEIAEKCNVEIEFGKIILPKFEVPEEQRPRTATCASSASRGSRSATATPSPRRSSSGSTTSSSIIVPKGISAYFLIVADFTQWAKEHGIGVGPGRGSAAGSIIAYALGITDLDPIEHGLLFERFLNPERTEMPDIDIDFDDERRGEVIEYVRDKYGDDKVAQIITFGTMKARAAVRDAGRVLGYPYGVPDKISKMILEDLERDDRRVARGRTPSSRPTTRPTRTRSASSTRRARSKASCAARACTRRASSSAATRCTTTCRSSTTPRAARSSRSTTARPSPTWACSRWTSSACARSPSSPTP